MLVRAVIGFIGFIGLAYLMYFQACSIPIVAKACAFQGVKEVKDKVVDDVQKTASDFGKNNSKETRTVSSHKQRGSHGSKQYDAAHSEEVQGTQVKLKKLNIMLSNLESTLENQIEMSKKNDKRIDRLKEKLSQLESENQQIRNALRTQINKRAETYRELLDFEQ